MRPNVIKATVVISEFLTYNVEPDEFTKIMHRFSKLEDTTRDREILSALAHKLDKVLGE